MLVPTAPAHLQARAPATRRGDVFSQANSFTVIKRTNRAMITTLDIWIGPNLFYSEYLTKNKSKLLPLILLTRTKIEIKNSPL